MKIFVDKIVYFLSVNSVIKDTQHVFGKGCPCLTNLLEFLDIATSAFDKVPHKRLVLQLLKAHGITGKVLNWLDKCFFFGRQHRVMLYGCKSEWKQRGAAGSSPGPILVHTSKTPFGR